MIRLTLLFLVTLLLGCSDKPKIKRLELSSDNHFKVALNEPIAYANVTADHIEVYIDVTISNAVLDLDKIKTRDRLSLETTFGAYDNIVNDLSKASNNAFLLYWVSTDSISRTKGLAAYQKTDSLFTGIGSDKDIYNTFQSYTNSEEGKTLKDPKKNTGK